MRSVKNDDDIFGFVAYDSEDQEVVVAFRGTNGLDFKNWYLNMKTDKVPYEDVDGALVHIGWYTAYQKLQDDIMTAVRDMIWNYQPKSIFVTGHSMGGALGLFAALDIKKNSGFLGRIQLYTYGQPRVGNN